LLCSVFLLGDFSASFFNFHLVFFDSSTWMLNPDTDRLIQIFPEKFFYDAAVRAQAITMLQFILLVAVAAVLHFSVRKQKKYI